MERYDEQPTEISVTAMARIGACASPSFSPDGSRLAFVSDLSGVPQVWTVPSTGGWPTRVTALDDQVAAPLWARPVSRSPDGAWLAFSLAPGGGLNQQIFVMRPDGTGLRRLTDGGRANTWLGRWTPDGRYLTFASNRRQPERMDVYLLDVTTGESRPIGEGHGSAYPNDVSRDGRWAMVHRMLSRTESYLYLVDCERGEERPLTPMVGTPRYGGGRFSPDGRSAYIVSYRSRDLAGFARLDLADGADASPELLLARDDAELEEFELSDDGALAALIWNVGGRSEVSLLDLETLRETPVTGLPAEVAAEPTFSRDARLLALTMSGSTAPKDIWVYDRRSAEWRQVTQSPHPGVDPRRLVRPELVQFASHDGLPLSGWLYRPAGSSLPGRFVVSFHGGPEAQERPVFTTNYQALLASGVAVFAPNIRGSTGFGQRFANLDNQALRFDAIKDAEACVEYLIRAGVAEPGRIGVMGGSYGGYMTLAALTEYPELFAAGAVLYGIADFEVYFAQAEPWLAAISHTKYGDPTTQLDLLRRLSPIHKIGRVTAPTLVLHGANDTNIPLVEAETVVDGLRRAGVTTECIVFPDEGHGFRKTHNRVRATTAIVDWFTRYL